MQRAVERLRRGQVAAERLLHHDPRAVRAAGLLQVLRHHTEQFGRDRQVVQRPLRLAQRLLQPLERGRVVVVAVDVAQLRRQLRERRLVDGAALLLCRLRQAVVRTLAQLLHAPARMRHADDRQVQSVMQHHRLQCRKDLLVGQVAGGAEKDQGIRAGCRHGDDSLRGVGGLRCPTWRARYALRHGAVPPTCRTSGLPSSLHADRLSQCISQAARELTRPRQELALAIERQRSVAGLRRCAARPDDTWDNRDHSVLRAWLSRRRNRSVVRPALPRKPSARLAFQRQG